MPATHLKRERFLDEFFIWAVELSIDISGLFENHQQYIDEIKILLERYGRALYDSGKSYGRYADTLKAIANWNSALRRLLQGAWDFGFSWNRFELSTHHSTTPGLVALAMLAMISTGFIWGWTCFAGLIALMWAGLLRPGGALSSVRADLLLLCDSDISLRFALLFCKD